MPGPDQDPARPEITLGIPAYNEIECLESVVRNGRDVLARLRETYEVLIVDDGSSDGTGALADRLAAQWPELRVVHHSENLSFSGALKSLYRNARGRWLFLCPADGQVDVADLERFLPHRDTADVILGYRLAQPIAWHQQFIHSVSKLVITILFGFRFREISNCKLYRVDLLKDLPLISRPGTATLESEVIFRLKRNGARFAEVPYQLHPRQAGTAKGARLSVIVKTVIGLFWLRIRLMKGDP